MMYEIMASGWIEAITGPMFSGKSEELIKRIKKLGYAKISTLVLKPSIDSRWANGKIISRAGTSIKTMSMKNTSEIEKIDVSSYKAIAIDEAQFFNNEIVEIIQKWANQGKRVIVSGLDMNYLGKPFGPMPKIISVAEIVDKQKAVCFVCGKSANFTFKKTKSNNIIDIGDKGYEARCRACYFNK